MGQRNGKIWAVLALFAIIYSSISVVNHYLIRTENLDLGLLNNVLWDYSHLQFNYSECLNSSGKNFLHDHFDIYLMLVSPFSLLFKTYTLIIFQIVAVLTGGLGIFKLAEHFFKSKSLALFSMVLFFVHWGIFSALSFDYHSSVVASMFIPWFLYHVFKQNWALAWAFLVLILIGKESMSLLLVFVCLGFMLSKMSKRSLINLGLMAFTSVLYYYLIVEVVLPGFANSDKFVHFRYDFIGSNSIEAIKNLVSKPFYYLKYLALDLNTHELSDDKIQFWIFLIGSGAFIMVFKPQFILMIIPIVFQKMFYGRTSSWGIHYYYSIELAPIMVLAVVYTLKEIKQYDIKKMVLLGLIVSSSYFTYSMLNETHQSNIKIKGNFLSLEHYSIDFDRSLLMESLEIIPEDAAVTGTSKMLGQLSYRNVAYRMHKTPLGDYFVWFKKDNGYPYKLKELEQIILGLKESSQWQCIKDNEVVSIYKKIVNEN